MSLTVEASPYILPPVLGTDLQYVSKVWNLESDPNYGVTWWNSTQYVCSAEYDNGDDSKRLLIGVSFDSGATFSTVLDTDGANNLDTIQTVSSSPTTKVQLRVQFFGANTYNRSSGIVELVEGRLATLITGNYVVTGRIPLPVGAAGPPGRQLEFMQDGKLFGRCTTREYGFWHIYLPAGAYQVMLGNKVLDPNFTVGITNSLLYKSTNAVINQENRSFVAAKFVGIDWAKFALYDTFEDSSKVLTSSLLIEHSRLVAESDRWLKSIALFIGVSNIQ